MLDATERKVLAITTFISSCICFAPGEWVSGALLVLASMALLEWHRRRLRVEAPPPPPAQQPAPPHLGT